MASFSLFANSKDSCHLLNTGHKKINKLFICKGYSIVEDIKDLNLVLNPNEEFIATVYRVSSANTNSYLVGDYEVNITLASSKDLSKEIKFVSRSGQKVYSSSNLENVKENAFLDAAKTEVPNCAQLNLNNSLKNVVESVIKNTATVTSFI